MSLTLQQGQRIAVGSKSADALPAVPDQFCVGVNWGVLYEQKRKWLRMRTVRRKLDLDLSAIVTFDGDDRFDHLYSPDYNVAWLKRLGLPKGKLVTNDGALRHSGDDRKGQLRAEDVLDNEIITVDVEQIHPRATQIFFFLNNVGPEDYAQIPFACIRLFEGTALAPEEEYARFTLNADKAFEGQRALILGKLYRKGAAWEFAAIGDTTDDAHFAATIVNVLQNYR